MRIYDEKDDLRAFQGIAIGVIAGGILTALLVWAVAIVLKAWLFPLWRLR